MNTDRLVEILATNLEPVKRGYLGKILGWALFTGAVAAFLTMLATLGLRPGPFEGTHLGFMAIKILFTISLVVVGAALLLRLIRPGQTGRRLSLLLFLPFIAIGLAAITARAVGGAAPWCNVAQGTQWTTCILCIPLLALIPFALLIWALRNGAPTNLRQTGAVVGLVAGAMGATVYAFHCADDSVPFIAIWYGGSIALCTFVGAQLGPRLLRW